jgi:hypothetical protein
MSTSYSDVCIGVNSAHQASENFHQKNHRFYRSSLDLFGLLLFFHKRGGFHGRTKYLASKMRVSERAIYKALDLLQENGFITRTKEGNQRLITCLITSLPVPPKKQKVQSKAKAKVQSLQYREKELRHNTNNVDVERALEETGVTPAVAHSLANSYSKQRIREVLNASRKQSGISNLAGWIVRALKVEFQFEGGRVEEPPRYQMFIRPKEAPDRSAYVSEIQKIRARIGILNR